MAFRVSEKRAAIGFASGKIIHIYQRHTVNDSRFGASPAERDIAPPDAVPAFVMIRTLADARPRGTLIAGICTVRRRLRIAGEMGHDGPTSIHHVRHGVHIGEPETTLRRLRGRESEEDSSRAGAASK
jgi:hypothetical protein